ncbi:MAG: VWA domain-containing protein [Ardenticatenales bacterium]|nr:VWA domain-containing protein [Ardenticatenales bacterium]
MRRLRSMGVAVGLGLIALAGLAMVHGDPAKASPAQAGLQQGTLKSSCVAIQKKTADPQMVLLGETVDVTLTVTALCAGESFPLHIVLVLDSSGSMAGEPNQQLRKAGRELIDRLDMKDNPGTQVGVVSFASSAKVLCQLTNRESQASSCVGRVGAAGGTCIDCGIKTGLGVMNRGRSGAGDRDSIREVMVVVSDGENNAGCPPVIAAAGQAKGQGILVITVCVGGGCDVQCMRSAATSPRYFFEARQSSQLGQIFDTIRRQFQNIILKRLTVIDNIPDNMQYIENSALPEPNGHGANWEYLEWAQTHIPKEGVTFSFKLRPLELGYHPTNNGAYGTYTDNKNRSGEFTFRDPWVLVLKADPQATSTAPPPPPPTPTPTPTNTIGPTVTPTNTPTVTPTPRPGPIYLPISVKEYCEDELVDVALVIDMSTSMNRPSEDGGQKKAAVISAAKAFVNMLRLTPDHLGHHDQVAIVGFNDDAWIEAKLSNNRGAILAALDNLERRQKEGTRLDKAFDKGMEALPPALRHSYSTPIMVMLTDGLPNRVPIHPVTGNQEGTVIDAAQRANDAGITVYTIGFGRADAPELIDRVLPSLLQTCASRPSLSFIEPRGDRIQSIYAQIADTFSCSGRHDWGQPWPPAGRGTN